MLLAMLLVVLSVTSGWIDDGPTASVFSGVWRGHTRSLTIGRGGNATEVDYSRLGFQLSDEVGDAQSASADAAVTSIKVGDKTLRWPNGRPRLGQRFRLHLRRGVITETLTGTTFCGLHASRPVCGA
jgi:hypothetical protein